jgi:hypothetical protein
MAMLVGVSGPGPGPCTFWELLYIVDLKPCGWKSGEAAKVVEMALVMTSLWMVGNVHAYSRCLPVVLFIMIYQARLAILSCSI